jgi:hypothetical protein
MKKCEIFEVIKQENDWRDLKFCHHFAVILSSPYENPKVTASVLACDRKCLGLK